MAAALSCRALLRSVIIRYGGWQQIHIRTLCTVPPDNSTDGSKSVEKSEWDKQREKIEKSGETVSKKSSSDSSSSSSSSSDSDETPVKEEGSQTTKSSVSEMGKQDIKAQNLEESSEQSIPLEKAAVTVEDKRAAAKKKLNDLLLSLATTDPVPLEPITKFNLAKPKPRKKAEKQKKVEEDGKLAKTSQPLEEIQIEPELVAASKEVAESLGGDVKATESELLSILRSHASEASFDDKPTTSLSDLFVGMKVERSQSKPIVEQRQRRHLDRVPADQPQTLFDRTFQQRKAESLKPGRVREQLHVDLFGKNKLGIFDAKKLKQEQASIPESILTTWDAAHQRELELSVTYPPANALVEMIQWTKQGKLWPLPVDNEMGLVEEKTVGFHEHVFLEKHFEGWCPKRGPVRHFMELVCTGLSKNPYLTVERKVRHINWYKNYFEEKHDLLKTIGAIEEKQ